MRTSKHPSQIHIHYKKVCICGGVVSFARQCSSCVWGQAVRQVVLAEEKCSLSLGLLCTEYQCLPPRQPSPPRKHTTTSRLSSWASPGRRHHSTLLCRPSQSIGPQSPLKKKDDMLIILRCKEVNILQTALLRELTLCWTFQKHPCLE